MAKWTDTGHAMRRRMGAPSNHFEATGASQSAGMPTLDDHYESAKNAGSSRVALGDGPIDTPHEVMSPEQNAPAEIAEAGSGADRGERNGASYRITASVPVMADPAHGPTTAGGRLVQSVAGRQSPNFYSAIQDSEQ